MNSITLDLSPIIKLTDEQYYIFATTTSQERNLRIERTPAGEIVIMPPTGGGSGKRNADLTADLVVWNRQAGLGVVFDSSTEFNLPGGGDRSPDVSWIKLERWNALSQEEREKFPPICPDFVIELRSRTDSFKQLQAKMQEYLDCGLRLGWLIAPYSRLVEIYRPGREVIIKREPTSLVANDVLPGFVLDMASIWS